MSYHERRLYRSTEERKIGGVAAGFAEYFGMSVIVVRIVFVLSLFIGFGLPLYLLFWLLTPRDPADGYAGKSISRILFYVVAALAVILGGALIVGATGLEWTILPFVFGLGIGMLFLFRGRRTEGGEAEATGGKRFVEPVHSHSDEYEAKIAGVCARVARVMGIDPVIVRVVSVILIPITFPLVPILYVVAALVMPKSSGAVSR